MAIWHLICCEVVEWLGAVLEELDFQNEAKHQSLAAEFV